MQKLDTAQTNIIDVIKDLNKGASVIDLSMALEEVVQAVKETGLPGAITYKIKVAPFKNNAAGDVTQIWVEDDIAVKRPCRRRKGSLFFPTRANTLSRNDPAQMEFKETTADESAITEANK